MMTRRRSIRTRLTLIAALAVTTIALLVAALAWFALRQALIGQVDSELQTMVEGRIGDLDAATITAIPDTPLAPPIAIRIQVLLPNGQSVTAPPDNPRLPLSAADHAVAAGKARQAHYTLDTAQGRFRVLTVHGAHGQTIQLGRSLVDVDATLQSEGILMIILVVGAAVAAALAGRLVAITGLRPIHLLTRAATQIATRRDLVHSIPHDDGEDEVAQLGRAFNQMLTALDHAQRAQRELIEDAAHELRTPMSSLRTNIELLIHAGARLPDADRQALLSDVHKQGVELSNLVADVVDLARSKDADKPAEPIDLASLAADAIERAQTRSPQARFTLHGQPSLPSQPPPLDQPSLPSQPSLLGQPLLSVTVTAQPTAIERAVVNLLDNAVKFGPAGQTIDVRVTTLGKGIARFAEISVADRAPAIPEAERTRIFHRFHRLDTARGVPGSGLGLAIVYQTAAAHGGTAIVEPRPGGGNIFRLRIPLSATTDPEDGDERTRRPARRR